MTSTQEALSNSQTAPVADTVSDTVGNMEDIAEKELHQHIQNALSSPSGQVLRAFLARHCFMQPGPGPDTWHTEQQLAFRYGRITLFQLLQYIENQQAIQTKE